MITVPPLQVVSLDVANEGSTALGIICGIIVQRGFVGGTRPPNVGRLTPTRPSSGTRRLVLGATLWQPQQRIISAPASALFAAAGTSVAGGTGDIAGLVILRAASTRDPSNERAIRPHPGDHKPAERA